MITEYIYKQLHRAKYEIMEDGVYFATIPGLKGVWAQGKTLETCREELREVLEEWFLLKLRDGDKIPYFTLKEKSDIRALPILKYA